MRFARFLASTVLGLVISCQASAAVINFESAPNTGTTGAHTSLSLSDSGVTVTFTRTTGSRFDTTDITPGAPATWGDRSLSPFFTLPPGDSFNANFSSAVGNIRIEFGDFGPSDNDTPVTITAYAGLNGTGAVVGTDTDSWLGTDSFPNTKALTIAGSGIQSIRFTSGGPFTNSLFWDNLTFDTAQVIPEPASMTLLAIGGIGLAGYAIRRRRKVA